MLKRSERVGIEGARMDSTASTAAAHAGGSACLAQVEGRSLYGCGRGGSPGSRLWMASMPGTAKHIKRGSAGPARAS